MAKTCQHHIARCPNVQQKDPGSVLLSVIAEFATCPVDGVCTRCGITNRVCRRAANGAILDDADLLKAVAALTEKRAAKRRRGEAGSLEAAKDRRVVTALCRTPS